MSIQASKKSEQRPILRRNLPLLMLQGRETIIALFRPILKQSGITEQQWRILRALLEHEALEPRQIGEICCLSSPSLAGVLARMDEVGLVKRERMPNDQRRVSVSLTPKSLDLAKTIGPQIEEVYSRLEKHVGSNFLEDFYRTLDELVTKMNDLQSGE